MTPDLLQMFKDNGSKVKITYSVWKLSQIRAQHTTQVKVQGHWVKDWNDNNSLIALKFGHSTTGMLQML